MGQEGIFVIGQPAIVLRHTETGLYFAGWHYSRRAYSANTVEAQWEAQADRAKQYRRLGAMERARALLGNVRPVGLTEAR